MVHFEGTIIITDPKFIAFDSDWENKMGFDFSGNMKYAPKRFFKTYLINDNYWGLGKWNMRNKKTKKRVGSYVSESGYTGIFYEKDILNYNPNFYRNNPSNVYLKIENFEGDVLNYINEDRALRVWEGKGNVNFITE